MIKHLRNSVLLVFMALPALAEGPDVIDIAADPAPAAATDAVSDTESLPAEETFSEAGRVGPWTILCGDRGSCLAEQIASLGKTPEGEDASLRMILTIDENHIDGRGADGTLSAVIPLGLNVSEPAGLVPKDKPFTVAAWEGTYTDCVSAGCLASGPVDSRLLSGSEEWIIRVLGRGGEYVGLPVNASLIREAAAELRKESETRAAASAEAEKVTGNAPVQGESVDEKTSEITTDYPAPDLSTAKLIDMSGENQEDVETKPAD